MKKFSFTSMCFLTFFFLLSSSILSCNKILPSQHKVTINVYDTDDIYANTWTDYDLANNTEKTTVFDNSKFNRTIQGDSFVYEGYDEYVRYVFDGHTWSDTSKLGEQEVFDEPIKRDIELYAYYDVAEKIHKWPIELQGRVTLVQYTSIPDNANLSMTLKLNGGLKFDPTRIVSGMDVPTDWKFTKVKGLSYRFGSLKSSSGVLDDDGAGNILPIYITGTPTEMESVSIDLEIPIEYIKDFASDFATLKGDGNTFAGYDIIQPQFEAEGQPIKANKYTEIDSEIVISARSEVVNGVSYIARFKDSKIEQLVASNALLPKDFVITPTIKGLTYKFKALRNNGRAVAISVKGIPQEICNFSEPLDSAGQPLNQVKVQFPQKYILNAPETDDKETSISTTGTYFDIGDITVSASSVSIKAVQYIALTKIQEFTIETNGAKFNPEVCKESEEVPTSWVFSRVPGLVYKFGSISNNFTSISVMVSGAPTSTSPTPLNPQDEGYILIPDAYILGGSTDANAKIKIPSNIQYDIELMSASLDGNAAFVGGKENYPLGAVKYIELGEGEGIVVKISLENAVFSSTIARDKITGKTLDTTEVVLSKWFSRLEEALNNRGGFTYEIENGGEENDYVDIRIKGVSKLDTVVTTSTLLKSGIQIAYTDIQNAVQALGTQDLNLYYTNNVLRASLNDTGSYYGTVNSPIQCKRNESIGGESESGVFVRIALENAHFGEIKGGIDNNKDTIARWFDAFTDKYGDLTYSMQSGGEGKDFIVVKITGKPTFLSTDLDYTQINIPYSDIKGGTSSLKVPSIGLYYKVTTSISVSLGGSELYKGPADYPIEGVQGTYLNDGNGVTIKVILKNAEWATDEKGAIKKPNLLNWFGPWIETGDISNDSSYELVSIDSTSATIGIKGALLTEPSIKSLPHNPKDYSYLSKYSLQIPSTDIKNADFSGFLYVPIWYRTTAKVTASLNESSLEYSGSKNNKITCTRFTPLNDGEGIKIRIDLQNGKFASDLREKSESINSWFKGFGELKNPLYTLYEVSANRDYVVIGIKGAITTPPNVDRFVRIVIPKEAIDGKLSTDLDPFTLYYKVTGEVSLSIEDIEYGCESKPIESVQYLDINNGDGRFVYFALNGGKFKKDLSKNVSHWFKNWTQNDKSVASYTIENGGGGESFAKVRVYGAITELTTNSTPTIITIPKEDIEGCLEDDLHTNLYYRTTGVVTASLYDSNGLYRGTNSYPLEGTKYVYLNENKGVNICVKLSNAKFARSLTPGKDVKRWFTDFVDLEDSSFIVTSGGADTDSVVVEVKGFLTTSSLSAITSVVSISKDDIDGHLQQNVTALISYRIIGEISASFDNSSSNSYVGSYIRPLSSVRLVKINDGKGVEARIILSSNAKFVGVTSAKIAEWFKPFADANLVDAKFTKIIGGENDSYVLFRIEGALKCENTQILSYTLNIPTTDIKNAVLPSSVPVELNYKTLGTVSVALDDNYVGASNNAIVGTKGIALNGKDGVLIKIVLTNAKFVSGINPNVRDWFKNWVDLQGSEFTLASSTDGTNTALVRVKGALVCDVSTDASVRSANIEIPSSAIDGFLEAPLSTKIYYRTENEVFATLSESNDYLGSRLNPIIGTQYIPLYKGDGALLRVELTNGAKFNSNVKPPYIPEGSINQEYEYKDSDVTSWFRTFAEVVPDLRCIVTSGGEGYEFIEIRLTGSVSVPLANKPSVYKIEIPSYVLDGYITNVIDTAEFYYQATAVLGVEVDGSVGYVGTLNSPLEGIRYIPLSDSVIIRFNLLNGATFVDDLDDDVSSWFANSAEISALNDGAAIFKVCGGGADCSYVTIKVTGALCSSSTDVLPIAVTIPHEAIKGFVEDDLNTIIYSRIVGNASAYINPGAEYQGSSAYPVYGTKGIVQDHVISVELSNCEFASSLTYIDVEKWFVNWKDFRKPESLRGSQFEIVSKAPYGSRIVIKATGYLDMDSTLSKPVVLEIAPSCINGVLQSSLTTTLYYKAVNSVTAYVDNIAGYVGTYEHPITGVRFVDINGEEGVKIRFCLQGGVFAKVTNDDIKEMLNPLISNEFTDGTTLGIVNDGGGEGSSFLTIQIKGALKNNDVGMPITTHEVSIPAKLVQQAEFEAPITLSLSCKISSVVSIGLANINEYYGTQSSPLVGVQHIPFGNYEGLRVRIALKNTTFKTLPTSQDLKEWFNSLNALVENLEIALLTTTQNSEYIDVRLTGAFKGLPNDIVAYTTLNVPSSFISWHDGYVEKIQTINFYYQVQDVIKAYLDETSQYRGATADKPMTGTQNIALNDGAGFMIKIDLKGEKGDVNVRFKQNCPDVRIGTKITGADAKDWWFKNFNDLTDPTYTIEGGGEGYPYVVIRVQGWLSSQVTADSRYVSIEVPTSVVDGYITSTLLTTFYYKCTSIVNIALDSGTDAYVGSEEYPLTGVQYLPFGSGADPSLNVKILLYNCKFANTIQGQTTPNPDVSGWFINFRETKGHDAPTTDHHVSYTLIDGGYGKDFALVRITGALTAEPTTTSKSVQIRIPQTDIFENRLINPMLVNFYYHSTDTIKVNFNDHYYASSEDYPLECLTQHYIGEGDGAEVRLELTHGKFAQGFIPKTATTNGTDMRSWFSNLSSVIDPTTSGFELISGGTGTNYATIRITGRFIASPEFVTDAQGNKTPRSKSVVINIPMSAVDAYLEGPLVVTMWYRPLSQASISLDRNYYGAESSKPVRGVQGIYLNNNLGVLIKIDLKGGTFVDNLNDKNETPDADGHTLNIKEWFTFWTALIDPLFEIETDGPGKSSVTIRVKGVFNLGRNDASDSLTTRIQIPSYYIKNAEFSDPIACDLYYDVKDSIKLTISGESGYYGTTETPIRAIQNIRVGNGDGQKVKVVLTTDSVQGSTPLSSVYLPRFKNTFGDAEINAMFKNVLDACNTASEPTMTVRLYEMDANYRYVVAELQGYVPKSETVTLSKALVVDPAFIESSYQSVSITSPSVSLENPSENIVDFSLFDGDNGEWKGSASYRDYVGATLQHSIKGSFLQTLGHDGEGVFVKLVLKNAIFDKSYVAANIQSVFKTFTAVFGNNIEVSIVPSDNVGLGDNEVVCRIAGKPQGTDAGSVKLNLSYQFVKGAADSFADKQAELFYASTTSEVK